MLSHYKFLNGSFQQIHQDNLDGLEKKVKQREDNLKFLKTQINHLEESILDLKGMLLPFFFRRGGGGEYLCITNLKIASCPVLPF